MRALRVHRLGEPPRLEELPDPRAGDGEVIVRLEATVVGRHDLSVAMGVLPLAQPLPYVPGLEGAGRLEDGTLVRVVGAGLGMSRPGTWAELVAAPAEALVPVPQTLAPELAAACGSSVNAAWAALFDVGGLEPEESVGITGATGAVGSLAVQLAEGRRIVAWSRTHDEDPAEPVDLLVDTVGGPQLPRRLRSVRPGGRAVLVGYTAGEDVTLELPALMHADVRLLPLNMRRRTVPSDVAAALLEDFAAGRLTLRTDVVPPEGIGDAIERLREGRANGRIVVRWDPA